MIFNEQYLLSAAMNLAHPRRFTDPSEFFLLGLSSGTGWPVLGQSLGRAPGCARAMDALQPEFRLQCQYHGGGNEFHVGM